MVFRISFRTLPLSYSICGFLPRIYLPTFGFQSNKEIYYTYVLVSIVERDQETFQVLVNGSSC